jgi:hypothetical protein
MSLPTEFFSIGSQVEFGYEDSRMLGIITGVAIYSFQVQYQVVWWDGGTRRQEWLSYLEIESVEGSKTKFGFK